MRISLIAFEPKQQPVPATELIKILPLRMKEPLRLADVREAIERLYATGRYADIAVDAETRNGEVVIRFLTQNNWFVGRVTVEGVPAPPSRSQLVNATQLDLGSLFEEEVVPEAAERIQQALRNNGFYDARIEPHFDYEPRTEQVNIRFEVVPGVRRRLSPPAVRGEPKMPVDRIIRATHWRGWFGWKPLTERRVQRGLERIRQRYQKQDRLMAEVSLERLDPEPNTNRAVPTLHLEAGPVVRVATEGARVSGGRLRRLVPVYEEQSVDRDLLVEGARNLTEHFQSDGYFDARVEFTSREMGPEERRIIYEIDRGDRYKLVRLEIHGNRFFDLDTIRERMYVMPASFQHRRGRYSESLLRADLDTIAELYRANGFRNVKLTSKVERDYGGRGGDVAVYVQIEEGDQWFVASLDIEGIVTEDEEFIRSMLQSSPGQAFSEANVAADRDNILAYYFNGGYPSAAFEWSFRPSEHPNRVDLQFTITEGHRQFVREVLISGLEGTRPLLVHRQILLNPGQPISQARMLETQWRLYDLGIFAKVDTAIQNPHGDEPAKYILYQLEESRKYSVTTGFGAEIARIGRGTTLESPAGEAGFSPRVSFDFSRLNLLGRAHTVSFRSRVSNLQQRALVSYLAPQFRGRENLDVSFTTLFDNSRDVRTFSAKRREGSVQLQHRWTRSRTLYYRFAFRRVSVDEATLNIRRELIPLLAQPVRVGMFSGSYVDDRRDNPADSRRGTFNQLDLGLASKGFGSQADFFRMLVRNSTYHPVGSRIVLARTTSFGWLQTIRTSPDPPLAEQDIPLPERFFAGGASTHRGFPENQAGPRDLVTGFPLGGKALVQFGTELRFPLIGDNLGGVLFHDAGNIYSRIERVSFRIRQRDRGDFDYMVHAAGFGIRYRTPIGPMRVDLAFAPNSPRFFGFRGTREELLFGGGVQTEQRISRFQFHFSLGQTF